MQVIKFKMRTASREIEIEGSRSDIDSLLEKWWHHSASVDATIVSAQNQPANKSPQRRPTEDDAHLAESNKRSNLDPIDVANRMKQGPQFEQFTRILNGSDFSKKAKLICWFVDQPISSGDVKRVLEALRVKAALPTISKALSRNSNDFIVDDKHQFPAYTLTAAARNAFDNELRQQGKSSAPN